MSTDGLAVLAVLMLSAAVVAGVLVWVRLAAWAASWWPL